LKQIFTKSPKLPVTILTILITIVGFLLWFGQQHFSPVTDELANIPAGLNYIKTGRYTDATQPPLLRYLFALPQWFMGVDVLANDDSGQYFWTDYGRKYLFSNTIAWQKIVGSARLIVIILTLLQIGLVYFFAKKLWNVWAGIVAALFIAFEPNTMAHGSLATLDMGLSITFLWSIYALWQYFELPNWKRFFLLHLAVGLAFLTKFSALTLFLSIPVCLLLLRKKKDLHLKRFFWSPLIFLIMVSTAYLFQAKSAGEDYQVNKPKLNISIKDNINTYSQRYGLSGEQVLAAKIPLYDFWKGFGMQIFHAMFQDKWGKKDTYQYLRGEYSDRGWRSYFAWSFLLKSTISTILASFLLIFFSSKHLIRQNFSLSIIGICLAISPIVFFVACSMGTINIGHRYLLPIYPFIALSVGYLAVNVNRKFTYFALILLLFHIGSSLQAYPHHLSYFNEFSRGNYYLTDSNIDWGQDLLFVQKDLNRKEVQATKTWGNLSGIVYPENLGFSLPMIPSVDTLSSGHHTIYYSVNRYLNRSEAYPDGIYPWLMQYTPTRKVGTSVLVYEILKE
jgi:4-amino-4-deoxy-L-arabinose transferase-like glycosyltransferase